MRCSFAPKIVFLEELIYHFLIFSAVYQVFYGLNCVFDGFYSRRKTGQMELDLPINFREKDSDLQNEI